MNKDDALKISLNNIFWSLGCYTRLEVKLVEYSSTERSRFELTDVDVLGVRISPELKTEYILGDCTTLKDIIESPIQRAFWLRGVMDFFNASKGYIALKTNDPIPETNRLVAHRLGITILNTENLVNLEKRIISSETLPLKLCELGSWLYFESNLAKVHKKLSRLTLFRNHSFWMRPLHENIHTAISLVTKHNNLLKDSSLFHKALVADILALLTLSVLGMSSYALSTNPEKPEVELRAYFYGGFSEMKRREGIVSNIKELLQVTKKQPELFDSAQAITLDPGYLNALFEIAYRFLNKPLEASQVPRYLQVLLFEKILFKSENSAGMKLLDTGFSDTTKKLARDMVTFFRESTGVSKGLLSDLY